MEPNSLTHEARTALGPLDPEGSYADEKERLSVVVVGAGIGGLAAATALRRAGHSVKVLEQSRFKEEAGAAIHVGPNASRVMLHLGCKEERLRPVHCRGFAIYGGDGRRAPVPQGPSPAETYKSPWWLVHRVDLHTELRTLAFGEEGAGKPAELHMGSPVVGLDPAEGTVRLSNGETHKADLIVGADGVHSTVRETVFGSTKPITTGISAFRFILDAKLVDNDETCISPTPGMCIGFIRPDKRVIVYPCRDGTLYNFVLLFESGLQEEVAEGWHSESSVEKIFEIYSREEFSSELLNTFKKATNVRCWQLLKRENISSWIKGRVCLAGDAAHPMLPHYGQGGGQAIEDAAALGQLFTSDTTTKQVERVLKMYNHARYGRASTIEWISATQAAGKTSISPAIIVPFILGHNVTEYCKQMRTSELIL